MNVSHTHRTRTPARDRTSGIQAQDTQLALGLRQLLLGLAKHLLPAGITPKYFGDLMYRAFVEAAAEISRCGNGRVNGSRVAVLTSLRRAEVKRLLLDNTPVSPLYGAHQPRTDRVIAAWMSDRRYLDSRGVPRTLPLRGRRASFASLVKEFAGDVPPRAVLEELRRLRVIREERGCMNLIAAHRAANRATSKSVQDLIDILLDGLEVAAPSQSSRPTSRVHRVALHARDSLDLTMMRDRANSGASAFLDGLERSLSAPAVPTRRNKKMKKELTIAVLVRENPGVRRKDAKR